MRIVFCGWIGGYCFRFDEPNDNDPVFRIRWELIEAPLDISEVLPNEIYFWDVTKIAVEIVEVSGSAETEVAT